jgi:probable rRNA maturation factor
MLIMKKHLFLEIEFHNSVRLSPRELRNLNLWLQTASEVMEELFHQKKIIHPSWLKNKQGLQVSLLLCGDTKIRQLNRAFRQKDRVTDVLSFPSFDSLRTKSSGMESEGGSILFLGDIAICHSRTQKQAREFSISYKDEFVHLFFHGMLHLLGYDHELSDQEEKIMEDWEKRALDLYSARKKSLK